jgi:hypothetical protein
MSSSLPRREFRTTQNNSEQLRRTQHTYIKTTLHYSADCVNGIVNVEVGPLVGTQPFSLESQNLRQKDQSTPDVMRPDSPAQY